MDVKAVKAASSDGIVLVVAVFLLSFGMNEIQEATTTETKLIGLGAIILGAGLYALNSYLQNRTPAW